MFSEKNMTFLPIKHKLLVVYMITVFLRVCGSCSNNLCLHWKLSPHRLILICKAGYLFNRIVFMDPHGNALADCLPPYPTVKCHRHYENGSISQNPRTNETIYVVEGKIDNHLNGNWTCLHGQSADVALVEVTIMAPERIVVTKNITIKYKCVYDSLLRTSISYLSTITVLLCLANIMKKQFTRRYCWKVLIMCWGKTYQKLRGIIFFLITVVFFLLTFNVGLYEESCNKCNCISKKVFPAIGPLIGVINIFVLLDKYEQKANERQQVELTSLGENHVTEDEDEDEDV